MTIVERFRGDLCPTVRHNRFHKKKEEAYYANKQSTIKPFYKTYVLLLEVPLSSTVVDTTKLLPVYTDVPNHTFILSWIDWFTPEFLVPRFKVMLLIVRA